MWAFISVSYERLDKHIELKRRQEYMLVIGRCLCYDFTSEFASAAL